MNKSFLFGAVAGSLMLLGALPANAQNTIPNSALVTLTAKSNNATPVTSSVYANLQRGLACVYNQTAHGSSPSTTFTIDQYDPATGAYLVLGTSTAVTTSDTSPEFVEIYPFAVPSAPPTGMAVVGLPAPRQFRVSVTVAGTGSTTGKVGCVSIP